MHSSAPGLTQALEAQHPLLATWAYGWVLCIWNCIQPPGRGPKDLRQLEPFGKRSNQLDNLLDAKTLRRACSLVRGL